MTDRNSKSKRPRKSIPVNAGDVFPTNYGGDVTILKYINKSKILVRFNDEWGYQTYVKKGNLLKGSISNPYARTVQGVGFQGVGEHPTRINKKETKSYLKWASMIRRCYSEKELEKFPTYRDCTVHPDWHNFQNFAEWHVNQEHYDSDYHLDKDLLAEGNKVYSPDTCVLIPAEINTLLNACTANRGDYPVGVSLRKDCGLFIASIRINGDKVYLGRYKTVEEAAKVYQEAKRRHVREIAEKWKGLIDHRVYLKLIS